MRRLEGLDAGTTEARAGQLLHGLGFTKTMQKKRARSPCCTCVLACIPYAPALYASLRNQRSSCKPQGQTEKSRNPPPDCAVHCVLHTLLMIGRPADLLFIVCRLETFQEVCALAQNLCMCLLSAA